MPEEGETGCQKPVEVLCRGHLEGLAQVALGLADVVGEVSLVGVNKNEKTIHTKERNS